MDPEFWHARWQKNTIGFHQGRPNAMLTRHFGALGLEPGGTVFVPLCGKAHDMSWLREHGHAVVGVELSPLAVRDFFREQHEQYTVETHGEFECVSAQRIALLRGDFFALRASHLALHGTPPVAVYDRAALVALPPQTRPLYARHLLTLIDPAAPLLLVTFEYPQEEMDGPPFSVTEDEVRALFESEREVILLETEEVLSRAAPMRARGLTSMHEKVYLIR